METPRNSDNYDISIHALRKKRDTPKTTAYTVTPNFNPRSP